MAKSYVQNCPTVWFDVMPFNNAGSQNLIPSIRRHIDHRNAQTMPEIAYDCLKIESLLRDKAIPIVQMEFSLFSKCSVPCKPSLSPGSREEK